MTRALRGDRASAEVGVLGVGDRAPSLRVQVISGRPVDVGRPGLRGGAVYFLRHGASGITRGALRGLDARWDELFLEDRGLIAVLSGPSVAAYDVVPRLHTRFPVVWDRDGAVRGGFSLPATSSAPLGSARGWLGRAFAALRSGRGVGPVGDDAPCAAFVVDADGWIVRSWGGRHAGEAPPTTREFLAT